MTDDRPAVVIPEPVWDRALAVIGGAEEVALACHVTPDADALGSMLGLALALRELRFKVTCSWGDEVVRVPRGLDFLPGRDLVTAPDDFPRNPPVLVTLDTGSRDRLGRLAGVADAAGSVVVIDHHARGDGFGDVRLVDTGAAATALIVDELVRRLGGTLTADVAACLYAALVADTGSLRFASATPAVHAVAARFVATGIPHDEVSRRLFDSHSLGYLRLLGDVLGRLRHEPAAAAGHGLVWSHTTVDDLAHHGVGFDELEALIGTVRVVEDADVTAVCKADADGSYKVSTRSRGAVDVGAACASLGGGGHAFAAGFTSREDLRTTLDRLRAALDEAATT